MYWISQQFFLDITRQIFYINNLAYAIQIIVLVYDIYITYVLN